MGYKNGEETRSKILRLLKKNGPMIQAHIAKKLNMSPPPVNYQLKTLVKKRQIKEIHQLGRKGFTIA